MFSWICDFRWIRVYDVFWSITRLTFIFLGRFNRHSYRWSVRQRPRRSVITGTVVPSPRGSNPHSRYFPSVFQNPPKRPSFRSGAHGKVPGLPRPQKRAQQIVRFSLRPRRQKCRLPLHWRQNGRRNGHRLRCVWLGHWSVAYLFSFFFSKTSVSKFKIQHAIFAFLYSYLLVSFFLLSTFLFYWKF